jgi:hypothetical protein
MPPIKCTPCRVTYQGIRYQVEKDGTVYILQKDDSGIVLLGPQDPVLSKNVRQEASRQRRNRNARERNQAMRDLGLKKTSYGWE